jgi:hypothetical protein
MPGMSRSKSTRSLILAPLAVLPFLIACGSSATKPPASASDKTDSAEVGDDADAKSGKDMNVDEEEKAEKKSDSDKSSAKDDKKDEKKSADKKADADDDDDKPPVDDTRTTAAVANIFKENRKAFKKCYEDVRKDKPELKGNVLLKVVLDGDGKVKKAYVDDESSIREQKVTDCMIKLAKTLTYPKSSKGLEKDFEYDFGFNNQAK